jgi:SOUL heme-binding protein
MRQTILFVFLMWVPVLSHAIEEPNYKVIREIGDVEIRHYATYVVAQTSVLADADKAGDQGFRILANYIFGDNTAKKKLAMTAPVMQAAQPESVKLAMTAPVMQAKSGQSYLVQFVLPKDITLATAPIPNDTRVALREVAEMDVAVITFSGFWSKANLDKQLSALTGTLAAKQLRWSGEPVYARYNPPWTPWFLRRHEIWLHLEP